MFTIKQSLFGLEESVDKFVIIKVVDDVKRHMGLLNDFIIKYNEQDTVDIYKNNIGQIESSSRTNSEILYLEIEEEPVEDMSLSLTNVWSNQKPVYQDDDIGSKLVAVSPDHKFNLTFRYENKSKNKINTLRNKLRLFPSQNDLHLMHNLDYGYQIPNFILEVLDNINTLKNRLLTTPLELDEYLVNTFDSRLTTAHTKNANVLNSEIYIKEQQRSVLGYFTSDLSTIKREWIEDKATWSISFTYSFSFKKPVQLIFSYPLVVYNRYIDKRFYDFILDNKREIYGNTLKGDKKLMELTESYKNSLLINKGNYYLTIPKQDTYRLPKPKPHYIRLLSIINIIDNNNPTLLFNLRDIPGITFKDEILDYLLYDKDNINLAYEAMFYIELYEDNNMVVDNKIFMDTDLNLYTEYPMNELHTYRLVINMLNNVDYLERKAKERIESYIEDKAIETDAPLIPFVEYFAQALNIDTSQYDIVDVNVIDNSDVSKEVLFSIKENDWVKYYTTQRYATYVALFKDKE